MIKKRSNAGSQLLISYLSLALLAVPAAQAKRGPVEKPAATSTQKDDPGCPECLSNATSLFARGENAQAANLLRSWSAKCPNNLQLHLLLNTVLMRTPQGREEALAAGLKACQIAPDSLIAHFQTALSYLTLQKMDGARDEYEKVVEIDPANYDGWLALSEIYSTLGEKEKAEGAKIKAQSLSPSARSARTRTIVSLDRAGNAEAARQEFKKLLTDESLPRELFLPLGQDAMTMGYFEIAESCFAKFDLKGKNPDTMPLIRTAQAAYFAQDRAKLEEAVSELAPALKNDNRLLALEALLDMEKGNYTDGKKKIETLKGARRESKGAAEALLRFSEGIYALADGEYKTAIEKFSDASNLDPCLNGARLWLAVANLKDGDYLEAASEARECQKVKDLKGRAMAIELRARLKDENANKKSLATLASELSNISSHSSDAQISIALAYLDLSEKNVEGAKQKAQKAQEQAPLAAEPLIVAAAAALAAGDKGGAANLLGKALTITPGDLEAKSLYQKVAGNN